MTRLVAHGLSECATETFFFFATVCSIRPNQQQQTSVLSPHLRQPCCVPSMTIVFLFGGVAFYKAGCGSAFLSATEKVRTQAAQLTLVGYSSSSAQCLFFNAVIGVVAKPNLFEKHVVQPKRVIVAWTLFFGKLLLESVSWLGNPLLWTRPLRPLLQICTSHSSVRVLSFVFRMLSTR